MSETAIIEPIGKRERAKAANRVASEKWPVEKAVDEMIARIKEVAG